MNAPVSGPEGYEYQYLMSCYLVLMMIREGKVSDAQIERIGREDLAIRLNGGETEDYQFKNRKTPLDLRTLATCLLKFDAGSDHSNVLSRLETGSLSHFYLVTSARCGDFAAQLGVLLQDSSLKKRVSQDYDFTIESALQLELTKVFANATTAMQKRRKAFVDVQLSKLSMDTALKDQLLKVSIIGDARKENVPSRIYGLLSQCGIPFSRHELILYRMVETIKEARANGNNVADAFKAIIRRSVGNIPEIQPNYRLSGNEIAFSSLLRKKQCILLTGAPLCGKSQTANYLINDLFEELGDLACRITGTILEAENFLLDNSADTRLCLLDDPFGQGLPIQNSPGYHKLESLIDQVQARGGKYLIVTSNEKALLNVTRGTVVLSDWQDLTVKDRSFLLQIWKDISGDKEMDLLDRKVEDMVMSSDAGTLLQPGQLEYIRRHCGELSVFSEATIRHLANFNSFDIEQNIRHQDKRTIELMLLMALTSSCINGISHQEFSYLLDEDAGYLPGINKAFKMKVYGGGATKGGIGIDQYKSYPQFSPEFEERLESIINAGYVRFVENEFRFAHPIYESGARGLLNAADNPFRTRRMLSMLEKGVGSLNMETALHTIDSLYVLTDYFSQREDVLNHLFLVAKTALGSTFVSVRDESLQFLLRNIKKLPDETVDLLGEKVRKGALKSSDYHWLDGIAYIPNRKQLSFTDSFSSMIDGLDAEHIWNDYQLNRQHLTPRDADILLEFLVRNSRINNIRIDFDVDLLLPFIRYDQYFIVENAIYLLAASLTENNYNQLSFLLLEDRPIIKFHLLKGLMRSYCYLTESTLRGEVLSRMKALMDDRFVALASLDLITQFNAGHTSYTFDWRHEVEESAEEKLWDLWAILSPVMVSNLPKNIGIHDARFEDAVINARVSDNHLLFEVNFAWFDWLNTNFDPQEIQTSAIARPLLTMYRTYVNKIGEVDRKVLTSKAYEIGNPQFHARFLRTVVHNWHLFSPAEQIELQLRLSSEPTAQKVVILTGEGCPDYFMDSLSGVDGLSSKDPGWIIVNLDQELLKRLLITLYIDPSTSEMEYRFYKFWNPVIAKLIEQPGHNCFMIAVQVFVEYFMGYPSPEPFIWPRKSTIGFLLARQCSNEQLEQILAILLENLGTDDGKMKRALDFIFRHISPVQQDELGRIMAGNIGMIAISDLSAIPGKLADKYFSDSVAADLVIKGTYRKLVKPAPDANNKKLLATMIVRSIAIKQMKLMNTLKFSRNWRDRNPDYFTRLEHEQIDGYFEYMFSLADKQRKANFATVDGLFRGWYLQ